MATLLNIKEMVTDFVGTSDATTANPSRDRIINRARSKFYSERRWSYLDETATLNFTSQEADLSSDASDYNYKFSPMSVYKITGGIKYPYKKVAWDEVDAYTEGSYVYAIDKPGKKIRINRTDVATLSMDYTKLPADKAIDTSEDDDEEPAPEIEAIAYLATAMWWLSSERSMAKYQIFMDEYDKELLKQVQIDGADRPVRPLTKRQTTDIREYRGK